MKKKPVSQLNGEGFFVGVAMADESPLEPGIFLIPGGAIDTEAPTVPDGQRAKWTGEAWALEAIPQPEPEPKPEQPDPLELCKAQAKTRLTDTDWAVLPDVNIENQAAFVAYRASVRALYLQPVAEPVWPERPEAVWL